MPLHDAAPSDAPFTDVLAGNDAFAADFDLEGVAGKAGRGLCVLTCMDSRLDPLRMLGLRPGDAKVLRNAGGRVTAEVLDTLVLAAYLLEVERVMIVAHTRCAMASGTGADLHEAITAAGGPDTRSLTFHASPDQEASLRNDTQMVRSSPYLGTLTVGGFRYDVDTGRLHHLC